MLEPEAEIDADWDKLADEREQALACGAVTAVPLELVVARLEARFPECTSCNSKPRKTFLIEQ